MYLVSLWSGSEDEVNEFDNYEAALSYYRLVSVSYSNVRLSVVLKEN